jgi:hypothetical protein
MGLGEFLMVVLVAGGIGFILWTMPIGQRVASRLGLQGFRKEGASQDDRDYLLRACGGDTNRVQQRLDEARAGEAGMSDARAYRVAIRKLMREKHGGKVA